MDDLPTRPMGDASVLPMLWYWPSECLVPSLTGPTSRWSLPESDSVVVPWLPARSTAELAPRRVKPRLAGYR